MNLDDAVLRNRNHPGEFTDKQFNRSSEIRIAKTVKRNIWLAVKIRGCDLTSIWLLVQFDQIALGWIRSISHVRHFVDVYWSDPKFNGSGGRFGDRIGTSEFKIRSNRLHAASRLARDNDS